LYKQYYIHIFPKKGTRQLAGPVILKKKKAIRRKQAALKKKKAIRYK